MIEHLALRILGRLGLLPYINGKSRVSVNGANFEVPLLGTVGVNNLWLSEMWLVELLKQLRIIRMGAFIDVGANIGQTLIKFRSVDRNGPYFGFEPNPTCVAYLERLIGANRFSNCQIIPVGLASESRVLPLYCRSDVDSAASLVNGFRNRGDYTLQKYVAVQNLDQIADSIGMGDVAIVKVDVEGAELDVLTGARELLAKSRPFILCEILPIYDDTTTQGQFRKNRQTRLESLLSELEYDLGRIDHSTGKVQTLRNIETHSDVNCCDYLLFPSERRPVLSDAVLIA